MAVNPEHLSAPGGYMSGFSPPDEVGRYHHPGASQPLMYPRPHPHGAGFMPPPMPHSQYGLGVKTDYGYHGYMDQSYMPSMLSPGGFLPPHYQVSPPGGYTYPTATPTPTPGLYHTASSQEHMTSSNPPQTLHPSLYPPPPYLQRQPPLPPPPPMSQHQASYSNSFNLTASSTPPSTSAASSRAQDDSSPGISSTGRLTCTKCSYTTSRFEKYEQHMKAHGRGSFVCKDCGKAFLSAHDLERHTPVHMMAKLKAGIPVHDMVPSEGFVAYENVDSHMDYVLGSPNLPSIGSTPVTYVYSNERQLMQDSYHPTKAPPSGFHPYSEDTSPNLKITEVHGNAHVSPLISPAAGASANQTMLDEDKTRDPAGSPLESPNTVQPSQQDSNHSKSDATRQLNRENNEYSHQRSLTSDDNSNNGHTNQSADLANHHKISEKSEKSANVRDDVVMQSSPTTDMFKVMVPSAAKVTAENEQSRDSVGSSSMGENGNDKCKKIFTVEDEVGLDDICKSAEDAINGLSSSNNESDTASRVAHVEISVDDQIMETLKGLEVSYHCNRCSYNTVREVKILEHVDAHRGHLVCDMCQKAYTKPVDLERHMQSHALGKVKGPSPLEDILGHYQTPRGYYKIEVKDQNTLLVECGEDNPLDAEYTFIKGTAGAAEDSELFTDHTSPLNIQLDPSNGSSNSIIPKNGQQQRSPTSNGIYYCKWCSYASGRQDKIHQHLRAHRGNIICQECGKAFVKQCDLDRHMISHTTGRTRRPITHNNVPNDESTGSVDGWDTLQAFPVSLQDVPGLANHSLSPHSQDSVSRDDMTAPEEPLSSQKSTSLDFAKAPSLGSKFPIMKSVLSAIGQYENNMEANNKTKTDSLLEKPSSEASANLSQTAGAIVSSGQREFGSISIMYDKPAYSTAASSMETDASQLQPNIQVANVTIVNNPPAFTKSGNAPQNNKAKSAEHGTPQVIKYYHCHKCEFSSHDADAFEQHLGSHKRYFPCPYCVLNFTSDNELQFHVNSDHSNLEKVHIAQQQNTYRPPYQKHATPPMPHHPPPGVRPLHHLQPPAPPMMNHQQPNIMYRPPPPPQHLIRQQIAQRMHRQEYQNHQRLNDVNMTPTSIHQKPVISPGRQYHEMQTQRVENPSPAEMTNKPRLQCALCVFSCETPQVLRTHLKAHHSKASTRPKDRFYFCELCGNKYISLSALRGHMKFHLSGRGHIVYYKESKVVRGCFVDCEVTGDNEISISFATNSDIDPRVIPVLNVDKVVEYLERNSVLTKQGAVVEKPASDASQKEEWMSPQRKAQTDVKMAQRIAANMAQNVQTASTSGQHADNEDVYPDNTSHQTSMYGVDSGENSFLNDSNVSSLIDSTSPGSSSSAENSNESMMVSSDAKSAGYSRAFVQQRIRRSRNRIKLRTISCPMCNYSTHYMHKLNEHMNAHGGRFICKICSKAFIKSSDLTRHMFVHDTNVNKKYTCKYCDYVTRNPLLLDDHMVGHLKGQTCPVCNKTFSKEALLRKHMEQHINSGEISPAKNEAAKIKTEPMDSGYNDHSEFVCSVCKKRFESREQLDQHEQMHWHSCPDCGQSFASGSALARHMLVHINTSAQIDVPSVRPRAPKVPRNQSVVVGPPIKGRVWRGRVHHGKGRKKKQAFCNICKKHVSHYYLKDHMRIHTGVRPFSCEDCGQAFALKQSYHTHRKMYNCRRQGYIARRVHTQYIVENPDEAATNENNPVDEPEPMETEELPAGHEEEAEPSVVSIYQNEAVTFDIEIQQDEEQAAPSSVDSEMQVEEDNETKE